MTRSYILRVRPKIGQDINCAENVRKNHVIIQSNLDHWCFADILILLVQHNKALKKVVSLTKFLSSILKKFFA